MLKADIEKLRNDTRYWETCATTELQTRRLLEKDVEDIKIQMLALQEEHQQLQKKFRKLISITKSLKTRLALSSKAVGQLMNFSQQFGSMIKVPLPVPL